jgi:adenosine deaminase
MVFFRPLAFGLCYRLQSTQVASDLQFVMTHEFIAAMPKVELHVHLEGSIRPETVLMLAERNGITLPATSVEGLAEWYQFRDFPHFVDVYVAVSKTIRTPDDLELIVKEFADGQAAQNILYSEVTYTASTIQKYAGIDWPDQRDALRRGRDYAQSLGIDVRFILDIVRDDEDLAEADKILDWVIDGHADGLVAALGIAGKESAGTAMYKPVFDRAAEAGILVAAHAGETAGPESIRETLEVTRAKRIGHGVRAVEDLKLVAELRDQAIPLEVCPSSNVCLGVFPSLTDHTFGRLLDEGVVLTVNSDDPPMFSTSLNEEWERLSTTFEIGADIAYTLTLNAVNAAFLTSEKKAELRDRIRVEWPGA